MTRERALAANDHHKLRAVMAFADEVTVLRRGRRAAAGRTSALTANTMAER